MGEEELRGQLTRTAEEFPVRGRPVDLRSRVVRRRRVTAGLSAVAGVAVAIAVAVPVSIVAGAAPDRVGTGGAGPDCAAPPASTARADYAGSRWGLRCVEKGTTATAIDIGAGMDLLSDGWIVVDDTVNVTSGHYTRSAAGFDVHDAITTAVGYGGDDPQVLATMDAFMALTAGEPASATARDTVVSCDGIRLVVQAGAYRLTFERTGPAVTPAPPQPTAPGRSS